jgi:exosome complex component RRP46
MTFEVNTSVLSRVDGSAELSVGTTKVITSVTGPIEPKIRQELPNLASLEIIVRPSLGVSTTREKALEDKLRSILQSIIIRYKYPRQLIQIVVQFLITENNINDNGSNQHNKDFTLTELNAAINCCYFALIDANIALYNSFSSTSICLPLDTKKENYIFNPNMNDLIVSESHHVICFSIKDSKAANLLLLESHGKFSEDQLLLAIRKAGDECESIHNTYQRKCIANKVENDFIWKS